MSELSVSVEGSIVTLTIDRADKRNDPQRDNRDFRGTPTAMIATFAAPPPR